MLDRFDIKYLREELEKLKTIHRSIKSIVETIERIISRAGKTY